MSVLAAEWIKTRSVRSFYLVLLVSLGTIGLGALAAWSAVAMYEAATPVQQARARIANLEEVVVIIPQLAMGVLGTLSITSEYATGLIRLSLAVVPRRWPLVIGKAVMLTVVGLVTGSAMVFATFFVSHGILGGRFPVPTFQDQLPTLVTTSLTVPVFALLGLGLGALLRSAAGAIALLVGLVYVIPMIVGHLPDPWNRWLGSVMIGSLPRQMTGADLTNSVFGSELSPIAAAGVLLLYAVLPVAAGGWRVCRADP
ncbi:ABC transporter permease [Nonomuraea sp. NBC_01738]|uniref:ABC transporter permease subunit n=1 Tax=Nonomuraea sp. NBC_01738 TaxID=2976003 RepID=UPI002E0D718A|nr:ABC transporter permease [Nonomuraea sp. NBC_01738]